MPPRCIAPFLRRARRLRSCTPIPYILQYLRSHPYPPPKHIKIDDEERQQEDEHYRQLFIISPYRKPLKMLLIILLTLPLVIILLAYTIYKPPNLLIRFFQWYYPAVIFHLHLPGKERLIALTIDDAPSPYTSQILDLLAAHSAKATFFIIGSQVAGYEDVIQRIHDEGHELGNHAWRDEPSVQLLPAELDRQVEEVERLLPANRPLSLSNSPPFLSPASRSPQSSKNKDQQVSQKEPETEIVDQGPPPLPFTQQPKYFRPGSGFFTQKMVRRLDQYGYRTVLGSVYPHDAQIPYPGVNARHVLSGVRSGSVVIMHDRRGYSTEEIGKVLDGWMLGGGRLRV